MSRHVADTITWALRDGVLVYVDDVPRGRRCGCTCASCGEPLQARRGPRNVSHFSHIGGQGFCFGAGESSAHRAAKEILKRRRSLWVPESTVTVPGTRRPIVARPRGLVTITAIELEVERGPFRADAVGTTDRGEEIVFEILVSHPVGEAKLAYYRATGLPVLEIDLRWGRWIEAPTELERLIVEDEALKRWLLDDRRQAEAIANQAKGAAERAFCRTTPMSFPYVENCPLPDHGSVPNVSTCTVCPWCAGVMPATVLCKAAPRPAPPAPIKDRDQGRSTSSEKLRRRQWWLND